jgi:murein tripeptide amidase MpaA
VPTGYLPADGIEGVIVHLAATYSSLTELITLPEQSIEHRTVHALKIANGSGGSRRGGLLIGGTHARELVNPDMLVSFATRLLQAYTNGTGLSFGPVSYSKGWVKVIVDTMDVIILPLLNPDGRAFVQNPAGDAMWRKNRNPNAGQPCKGVDLNRNYDFLWSSGIGTSASSCSDVFKGAGAFSEPETRNVKWLLDDRPNIVCFADVHSYSQLVLYPWGDDDNQSSDPNMNFANPAFDGQRGVHGAGYREYIPSGDAAWFDTTGKAVRDAIAGVRGRTYSVEQGILLYPTSATAHDYAYSRHFVQAGSRKVMAFTIETGTEFQPPWSEAQQIIDEVSSGLVALLQGAMCAAESVLTGTSAAGHLDALRALRDDVLLASPAGRRLVALFETYGAEIARRVDERVVKPSDIAKVVNAWARAVRGDFAGGPMPSRVVDDATDLLKRLADGASPALQRAARTVGRDLEAFRGRSVTEALGALPKRRRG